MDFRERCTASEKALPVAEYRVKLAQLHNDMLDEIARLNAEIAAKSDAYRDNIATWMTKYGDKAAECHELRTEFERLYDAIGLQGDDRCADGVIGAHILNRNAIKLLKETK